MGSSTYESPTADCPAKITNYVHRSELVKLPRTYVFVQTCYQENDRPRGRSLYSPQNFSKDLPERLGNFPDRHHATGKLLTD